MINIWTHTILILLKSGGTFIVSFPHEELDDVEAASSTDSLLVEIFFFAMLIYLAIAI